MDTFLELHLSLGEGAFWDAAGNRFLFVDIEKGNVYACREDGRGMQQAHVDSKAGTVVPYADGSLLVAGERRLFHVDMQENRVNPFDILIPIPACQTLNDGKCDCAGNLWIGTETSGNDRCTLYRVDITGRVRAVKGNLGLSNGLVWSKDNTVFYHIDTPLRRITKYGFEVAEGTILNPETVVEIPASAGLPDGMAIDADGNLWVAMWGGGSVNCYHSGSGKLLDKIEIPTACVTSCAFGGAGLDTLYITTAVGDENKTDEQRQNAGNVFRAFPGVVGVPGNYAAIAVLGKE
ncbi:MAG: SMP-30/gluconolactonase/LRE family protein [Lachnospiraceae bacterium]|nr:SMP-30/gluconolactonase/LRE family protein [Lachnospiraceae bacterium]